MRVLIADDHDLVRETLAAFLLQVGGITSVGVRDFASAAQMIRDDGPFDLVLLDFSMPGMNGLNGLRAALELTAGKPVALMSGVASRTIADAALEMGAAGFLPKTLSAKSLANAVRFMAMGEKYAPVDFATSLEPAPPPLMAKMLTMRELQVLEGLCQGKSNKEIARDLDLTEPTVKLHIKTLYRKIGAANRTQAAMLAKEAGVF
ncbi:MAG: response regulator transcription factor [Gemmobacter sp.]|nr:response regulator transcription factor [Gemmobacter sp.]